MMAGLSHSGFSARRAVQDSIRAMMTRIGTTNLSGVRKSRGFSGGRGYLRPHTISASASRLIQGKEKRRAESPTCKPKARTTIGISGQCPKFRGGLRARGASQRLAPQSGAGGDRLQAGKEVVMVTAVDLEFTEVK